MKHLIIEGLTGAGKSSVISELSGMLPADHWKIIYEDDTLGELLNEIPDKTIPDHQKCYRLRNVMDRMQANSGRSFLLERFHPSYYAMIPDWGLYAEMDRTLAADHTLLVLLYYAEDLFEQRAVRRADRRTPDGTDSAIEYWGSLERALEACRISQDRRIECLRLTAMRHIAIDTSDGEWRSYAEEIMRNMA